MAEKNILVNRGIPPGSSSGASHFGNGWNNRSYNLDMTRGAGAGLSATVTVDGAPVGSSQAVAQNPFYLMQSALEESLGEGRGWLPYDAYPDLGMDFWGTVPYQLYETRREMAGTFDRKRNQQLNSLKAEMDAAGVSDSSIDLINRSLKFVQNKLSQWEDALAASVAKLMENPARDYLERSINDIMADLKRIGEDGAPSALDQELAGFRDACQTANDMAIRDSLAEQNARLADARSMQQALAQAKWLARLSNQEKARELARQPLFDRDFLSDKEGGLQTSGYVPMVAGKPAGTSGVTLGTGVDLGSKTSDSLLADGVPPSLVAILGEYTGLRGQQAVSKLKNKPLTITETQAKELSDVYFDKLSSAVERRFNNAAGADKFRNISYNTRTAIIDLSFQYSDNLPARTPKAWQMMLDGNWTGLIQELNNFGDAYPSRRKSEAQLIQQDIDLGLLR
ncbi:pesticin C-terminus-like muramidase [Pseudomonas sp. TE50-2]|uniref:pesticin C-terminus-like muramidase n=1 Tax=Pseudomonas sp. TE50-2 TaxID=3142707 RepID=UPI0034661FCF